MRHLAVGQVRLQSSLGNEPFHFQTSVYLFGKRLFEEFHIEFMSLKTDSKTVVLTAYHGFDRSAINQDRVEVVIYRGYVYPVITSVYFDIDNVTAMGILYFIIWTNSVCPSILISNNPGIA